MNAAAGGEHAAVGEHAAHTPCSCPDCGLAGYVTQIARWARARRSQPAGVLGYSQPVALPRAHAFGDPGLPILSGRRDCLEPGENRSDRPPVKVAPDDTVGAPAGLMAPGVAVDHCRAGERHRAGQPITGIQAMTAATITVVLDDYLSGGPADERLRLGSGGTAYAIDLSDRSRIPASIVQQYQAATGGR